MKTHNILFGAALLAPCSMLAQNETDFNAGMRIETDPSTGANTISWWGKENHV